MDNEIHFLTYDPDAIWREMIEAYMEAGGDMLYPGDEKEMIFRGVLSIITQVFAGVDAGMRMATTRYAQGEYLDIKGEDRNCERITAQAATCTVEINFKASGVVKTIPAGTAMTGDGEHLYMLSGDVQQTGANQTVRTEIVCTETGSVGNGLLDQTQMQFIISNPAVVSVYTIRDASGGQDEEDDEAYRERIRTVKTINTTTGTQPQYESIAQSVSSEIIDVRALNIGAGVVGVYLLLETETGSDAIMESVHNALHAVNTHTLTDNVQVSQATKMPYTLNVQYSCDAGSNIEDAMGAAVEEYRRWQNETIGRAFNPDKLMAMLYQAGATRVVWGEGSQFAGGKVEYTTIANNACCDGTISISVMA